MLAIEKMGAIDPDSPFFWLNSPATPDPDWLIAAEMAKIFDGVVMDVLFCVGKILFSFVKETGDTVLKKLKNAGNWFMLKFNFESEYFPLNKFQEEYRKNHFVNIGNFLEKNFSQDILKSISQLKHEFYLYYNTGIYEFPLKVERKLSDLESSVLNQQLEIARNKSLFTYLCYLWKPHTDCQLHQVCNLIKWFDSQNCWNFITDICGERIEACDIIGASCYRHGNYLGAHHDRIDYGNYRRKVAFVLNLSENWEACNGGIFTLIQRNAEEHCVVPTFNQLTLFDVEINEQHYISKVKKEGVERIALTGFFCIAK